MATTGVHAIKSTPGKVLEYVSRPEKTEDGILVFSGKCSTDWKLADVQMRANRRRYGKDKGILLHHGYVAFPKGEVSLEMALDFAKEWMATRFSDYQYFGSVHVDTDHVHFNWVINAVSLDGRKYNNCTKTLNELRAHTDQLCEERGLSIVIPKKMGMSYKEFLEQRKENSWHTKTKDAIDETIQEADTWDDFLTIMKAKGFWIKYGENVKHILFRAPGAERGCRGRTLGAEYTEQAIKDRIRFKEFCFEPGQIHVRRPDRFHTPLQHELRSLSCRRPGLAVTFALGIHLLGGSKKIVYQNGGSRQKKYPSKSERQVQELARQLLFVREHQIQNRMEIEDRLKVLREKKNLSTVEKAERKEYQKLLNSLDEIRGGDIFEMSSKERGKSKKKSRQSKERKEPER